MSRSMQVDSIENFRVIVTNRGATGRPKLDRVNAFGPFATLGVARSIRTREIREARYWGGTITAKIQRATTVWEDIE